MMFPHNLSFNAIRPATFLMSTKMYGPAARSTARTSAARLAEADRRQLYGPGSAAVS